MQYLLMIHGEEGEWESLSEDERGAVREQFMQFADRARESGALVRSGELQPTDRATTVRVANGETIVTDGPYAETKEALGGFFLVECDSIDAAVGLAEQLPQPGKSGAVEVRPVHVDEGDES